MRALFRTWAVFSTRAFGPMNAVESTTAVEDFHPPPFACCTRPAVLPLLLSFGAAPETWSSYWNRVRCCETGLPGLTGFDSWYGYVGSSKAPNRNELGVPATTRYTVFSFAASVTELVPAF